MSQKHSVVKADLGSHGDPEVLVDLSHYIIELGGNVVVPSSQ